MGRVIAVRRSSRVLAVLALVVTAVAFQSGLADARAGKFLASTVGGALSTTTTPTNSIALSAASTSTVGPLSPTVFMTVNFTEVGLGSGKSIKYAVGFTDLRVDLLCVNNGNNQPQGQPMSTHTTGVSTSQQLTADSKGNIDGTLSWNLVDIAAASNHFRCPSGQIVEASRVDVEPSAFILDQTNSSSSLISASYPLLWPLA